MQGETWYPFVRFQLRDKWNSAFVTRGTKDRYAGGALRNEETGQTIQLSVDGQRKRCNGQCIRCTNRGSFFEKSSGILERWINRWLTTLLRFRMSLKCVQGSFRFFNREFAQLRCAQITRINYVNEKTKKRRIFVIFFCNSLNK